MTAPPPEAYAQNPNKIVSNGVLLDIVKKAILVISFIVGAGILGSFVTIYLMPDVYIVPFGDVSVDAANTWGEFLGDDLNIRFKVLNTVSFPPASFNFARRQFITETIADAIVQIRHKMLFKKSRVVFIGLLNHDMYPTTHDWRYCYALNFLEGERNRISVISTKRLSSTADNAQKVFTARLYKLLKRAIGFQLYGCGTTSNSDSVLYGPLLSVEDLDNMGMKF